MKKRRYPEPGAVARGGLVPADGLNWIARAAAAEGFRSQLTKLDKRFGASRR